MTANNLYAATDLPSPSPFPRSLCCLDFAQPQEKVASADELGKFNFGTHFATERSAL